MIVNYSFALSSTSTAIVAAPPMAYFFRSDRHGHEECEIIPAILLPQPHHSRRTTSLARKRFKTVPPGSQENKWFSAAFPDFKLKGRSRYSPDRKTGIREGNPDSSQLSGQQMKRCCGMLGSCRIAIVALGTSYSELMPFW